MSNTSSTESQRRFIESLAKNLSDEELCAAIKQSGHAGAASWMIGVGTRNQALKGVTKSQASKLIDILKSA